MQPIVTADGIAWYVCLFVTIVSPAKWLNRPIEMLFGLWLWTRVGPSKHGGATHSAIWRIQLNAPCAAAKRPFCQITLHTEVFRFDRQ